MMNAKRWQKPQFTLVQLSPESLAVRLFEASLPTPKCKEWDAYAIRQSQFPAEDLPALAAQFDAAHAEELKLVGDAQAYIDYLAQHAASNDWGVEHGLFTAPLSMPRSDKAKYLARTVGERLGDYNWGLGEAYGPEVEHGEFLGVRKDDKEGFKAYRGTSAEFKAARKALETQMEEQKTDNLADDVAETRALEVFGIDLKVSQTRMLQLLDPNGKFYRAVRNTLRRGGLPADNVGYTDGFEGTVSPLAMKIIGVLDDTTIDVITDFIERANAGELRLDYGDPSVMSYLMASAKTAAADWAKTALPLQQIPEEKRSKDEYTGKVSEDAIVSHELEGDAQIVPLKSMPEERAELGFEVQVDNWAFRRKQLNLYLIEHLGEAADIEKFLKAVEKRFTNKKGGRTLSNADFLALRDKGFGRTARRVKEKWETLRNDMRRKAYGTPPARRNTFWPKQGGETGNFASTLSGEAYTYRYCPDADPVVHIDCRPAGTAIPYKSGYVRPTGYLSIGARTRRRVCACDVPELERRNKYGEVSEKGRKKAATAVLIPLNTFDQSIMDEARKRAEEDAVVEKQAEEILL